MVTYHAVAYLFAHGYTKLVLLFPVSHYIHNKQTVCIGLSISVYILKVTVLLNGRKSFHIE